MEPMVCDAEVKPIAMTGRVFTTHRVHIARL